MHNEQADAAAQQKDEPNGGNFRGRFGQLGVAQLVKCPLGVDQIVELPMLVWREKLHGKYKQAFESG